MAFALEEHALVGRDRDRERTADRRATGRVLAEIYDASGLNRTANSPRLMNVSVLRQIEKDGSLTAGFVIDGKTARTVLVRRLAAAARAAENSGRACRARSAG